MSDATEGRRNEALKAVHEGNLERAAELLEALVADDPGAADHLINLASVEKELGRLRLAAQHFEAGAKIVEEAVPPNPTLLGQTLAALGATYQALELTEKSIDAFRLAAKYDARAPQPLAGLAAILARAGHLAEADRAATGYCKAAVSILSEKENIGAVRRFQKAMKEAATVDGLKLLAATREAYVHSFAELAKTLPEGVRLEEEPYMRDEKGNLVSVLANPRRPFSRVRFDAIDPKTGQRWMIHETPTYGYPKDAPAASEGFFSVATDFGMPFPVLVATRTAWDYFFLRLRFKEGLRPKTITNAERILGDWYARGVGGAFAEEKKGYFHFFGEPYPIGDEGVRYEIDLGLSRFEAVIALVEALETLHQLEPLDVVVMGDGMLPARALPIG